MRKYLVLLTLLILGISYSQIECNFIYYIIIPQEATDIRNPTIRYFPVSLLDRYELPVFTASPNDVLVIEIGGIKYNVYVFDIDYVANSCKEVYIDPFVDIKNQTVYLFGTSIPSSFGKVKNIGLNISFTTAILGKSYFECFGDYCPSAYLNLVGIYDSYGRNFPITLPRDRSYYLDFYHTGLSSLRVFAKEYKILCSIPSRNLYYYSNFFEDPNNIQKSEIERRWFDLIGLRNDLSVLSVEELEKKGYFHCRIYKERDVSLDLISTYCNEGLCRSKFKYEIQDPESTFVTFYAEVKYDYAFLRRQTLVINLGSRSIGRYQNEILVGYNIENPSQPNYIVLLPNETFKEDFVYHRIVPIFRSPFTFPSRYFNSTIIYRNISHTVTINVPFYLSMIRYLDSVYFEYIPQNKDELLKIVNQRVPFNLIYKGIVWNFGRDSLGGYSDVYFSNNFIYRNTFFLVHVNLLFENALADTKFFDNGVEITISFKLIRNDTFEEFKNAKCYVNYIYAGKNRFEKRKIGPFFENEMPIKYNEEKGMYYSVLRKTYEFLGITKEEKYLDYEVFCTLPFETEFEYFIGREKISSVAIIPLTFLGFELTSISGLQSFLAFFFIFFIPALVGYFVRNIYFSTIVLFLVAGYFFVTGYIPLYVLATIVIIGLIILFVFRIMHLS